ncbi:hypothetical protein DRQ09_01865 [candidate division KSB1 bacterium]|nr:MAG: hypothetical protein DRQ09_01865 [candidate division KSB1 bacterium]
MKAPFLRINLTGIFASIVWLCIVLKLLHIQVIKGKFYEKKAINQHSGVIEEPAQRGTIFDRNYKKLALDLEFYDFFATPRNVKNPERVAQFFARVIRTPKRDFIRKLKSKKGFVYLIRNVDAVRANRLPMKKLKGVSRKKVYHRYYPYGKFAGQIIGCTDIDNKPLTGIDLKYNNVLKGTSGKSYVKYDGKGRIIPDLSKKHKKPVKGKDIILTIDLELQQICEDELEKGVKSCNAKGGTSIIMNPFTGEILAMASYPGYDPNMARYYNSEVKKIKSITDIFEPGSTFKFVTISAAIEENIKKPDDIVYCENGVMKVYDHIIRDVKKHKWLSIQQVFEKSSNIGTYKIATKVGKERLYKYARNYGFGKETGIDLIGEVPGILKFPKDWSGISLAEVSIGYEVAVTPIQMINAYSAIANGGNLMKPYIVKAVVDRGKIVWSAKPEVIRKVISKRTANILTAFMEGVVKRGTGKKAKVKNLRIAGKTGTAQKVSIDGKGYSRKNFISSFVGFFPSEKPEYIILIKIDSPKGKYYGGEVAAPLFKNIVQKILLLPRKNVSTKKYVIKTDKNSQETIRVPDFRNIELNDALSLINSLNIKYVIKGKGELVVSQKPSPGKNIKKSDFVTIFVDTLKTQNRLVVMPNVIGLSARRAINELAYYGIDFKIAGNGVVKKQVPVPGKKVLRGRVSYLDCSPVSK